MKSLATKLTMTLIMILHTGSQTPGIGSTSGLAEFVISQSGVATWTEIVHPQED